MRPSSEVRAVCGNTASTDLRGGLLERAVPTANLHGGRWNSPLGSGQAVRSALTCSSGVQVTSLMILTLRCGGPGPCQSGKAAPGP